MKLSRLCREKKIAPQLVLTLLFLRDNPKISLSNVAYFFGCTPAAVTGRLDTLEKRKWIKRRQGSRDHRVYEVEVTNSGILAVADLKMGCMYEDKEEDSDGFRS